MKIGIDARFYGLKHAGLGRYVKNLVLELEKIDHKNDYYIFLQAENFNLYRPKNRNFRKIKIDNHPYSIKSQLLDWRKIGKLNLDLVHFTHFSYPILYRGKFIITIHDLIKNRFYDKGSTTRFWVIYRLKHWGYQLVLNQGIKRSKAVITPSKFVKEEILANYQIDPAKIIPVYEGAEDKFQDPDYKVQPPKEVLERYGLKKPYLLYVGNVYPYKNVDKLLEVFEGTDSGKQNDGLEELTLAVVCARSVFYERLSFKIKEKRLGKKVKMLGYVPDEDLKVLYQNARCFITASLSEGFGITGLEAMASGCAVLSSNFSCLPEVYGEAALYFNPLDKSDIIDKIKKIVKDSSLQKRLITKGLVQVKKYSWRKMTEGILRTYQRLGEK